MTTPSFDISLTHDHEHALLTEIAAMYANLAGRSARRAQLTGSQFKRQEAFAFKCKVVALEKAIQRLEAAKAKAEARAKFEAARK